MSARFFEPLENRRLMTASLVNGVLTVTGTELHDVIAISQDKTRVRVNEAGRVSAFRASGITKVVVKGLGGDDRILGRPNLTKPLIADGGPGEDLLVGGSAADQLFGGVGPDLLDGAKGSDLMSGGEGIDRVDFSARSANLSISLDDIADDGETGERDNVRSDIEAIRAGKGNDRIIGSGVYNHIFTGDGADTVYGMGGNDYISTGDTAADTGLDRVYGGDGDDQLRSQFSSLIAYGEQGNDIMLGSDRNDTFYGGAGYDTLRGFGGNDLLDGGDDDDTISGNDGNDTIRGWAGNDSMYGDVGDDLIWGEAEPGFLSSIGIDTRVPTSNVTSTSSTFSGMISPIIRGPIFAGGGNGGGGVVVFKPIDPVLVTKVNWDTIVGGEGNDTIHGGDGNDLVAGDVGNDRLLGDAGADDLVGSNGDDELFGGPDDDKLSGGPGADTLVSIGGGTDSLRGEQDGDRFWKDPGDTTDADLGEILFGGVQEVASFANGISRELEGQNLPDPTGYDLNNLENFNDDYDPVWKNFATNPVFGGSGILATDVQQGGVGDGYLLTALRAIAGKQAYRIKQSIVDLGDGTFAVKFIADDGAHRYYRVDADLPVKPDGTPYYAGLGNGGSMWAAIMEKAFALHRAGPGGTYHSLQMGQLSEAFGAFGMRLRERGGDIRDIKWALASGKFVTMQSTGGAISGGAALMSNTTYIVERVNMETQWEPGFYVRYTYRESEWHPGQWVDVPVSITLRDPSDREITIRRDQINRNFDHPEIWL